MEEKLTLSEKLELIGRLPDAHDLNSDTGKLLLEAGIINRSQPGLSLWEDMQKRTDEILQKNKMRKTIKSLYQL